MVDHRLQYVKYVYSGPSMQEAASLSGHSCRLHRETVCIVLKAVPGAVRHEHRDSDLTR